MAVGAGQPSGGASPFGLLPPFAGWGAIARQHSEGLAIEPHNIYVWMFVSPMIPLLHKDVIVHCPHFIVTATRESARTTATTCTLEFSTAHTHTHTCAALQAHGMRTQFDTCVYVVAESACRISISMIILMGWVGGTALGTKGCVHTLTHPERRAKRESEYAYVFKPPT